MRSTQRMIGRCAFVVLLALVATRARAQSSASPAAVAGDTAVVRTLVARLDLERYKATIKGLTEFGDRRQGTDRNRAAVDWIEAQLKSYGCTNTARITYDYQPSEPRAGGQGGGQRGRNTTFGAGGS